MPNYRDPFNQSAATQEVLENQRRNPRFEDVAPQNQFRPIPNETLWKAGTGIQNYFPAVGQSLRKIGGGLRLEPNDYVSSALEGASLVQTPATPAIMMARQAANVGKQVISNNAAQTAGAVSRNRLYTKEGWDKYMANPADVESKLRSIYEHSYAGNRNIDPILHDKSLKAFTPYHDDAAMVGISNGLKRGLLRQPTREDVIEYINESRKIIRDSNRNLEANRGLQTGANMAVYNMGTSRAANEVDDDIRYYSHPLK